LSVSLSLLSRVWPGAGQGLNNRTRGTVARSDAAEEEPMTTSEREMVRKLELEDEVLKIPVERSTSLQPTYEDTIAPDPEDWELDD
jgi:hypothetical protein